MRGGLARRGLLLMPVDRRQGHGAGTEAYRRHLLSLLAAFMPAKVVVTLVSGSLALLSAVGNVEARAKGARGLN